MRLVFRSRATTADPPSRIVQPDGGTQQHFAQVERPAVQPYVGRADEARLPLRRVGGPLQRRRPGASRDAPVEVRAADAQPASPSAQVRVREPGRTLLRLPGVQRVVEGDSLGGRHARDARRRFSSVSLSRADRPRTALLMRIIPRLAFYQRGMTHALSGKTPAFPSGQAAAGSGSAVGRDSWARTRVRVRSQVAAKPMTSANRTPRLAKAQSPPLPPRPRGPSR